MSASPTVIRISPNPPVFDLPIQVALEKGLFAANGLDVRFAAAYSDHDTSEREVLKRQKESLFEDQKADAYNVCEWGGIDRLERGEGQGRIAALRPAIAAQAILAFDPAIQTPRDLAGVPIGINEFTGSHFVTVQTIEGAIGKDAVKLEHIGAPETRLRKLRDGEVRAAAVMEPWISLGLKQGAHIVALSFYRGAEVVSPHLNEAQREAFFRALDQAVDLINADFGTYAHHLTKATDGALTPGELAANYGHFIRYRHAQRYEEGLFTPAYNWMHDRGYSEGKNTHASLVVS
ncbi:ABC transporter substrate-binding protein [Roseococcus sp. YIM B11640]|uniref:ABC transporter substrate-binding protein n=1 Tax=Roseococcus sp. YIM B11640 TaxID=3133973 RepID=UPI003C7A499C